MREFQVSDITDAEFRLSEHSCRYLPVATKFT